MNVFEKREDRRVIPRWRPSSVSLLLGESSSLESVAQGPPPFQLAEAVSEWRENRSFGGALDLVSAAWGAGFPGMAGEAASYLREGRHRLPGTALLLVQRILDPSSDAAQSHAWEEPQACIRRLRQRLREDPRDVLSLVDIARCYASVGLKEKAESAIDQAVALAPNHRFTLRSAVRFFVHVSRPDTALHILKRSARTKFDPWLIAADISVASVAGRPSKLIREGRSILASKLFAPVHISELASALATLEMKSGSLKQAKKLFATALISPTDNTIAQAEWASAQIKDVPLTLEHLSNPLSFEARVMDGLAKSDWKSVVENGFAWHMDEPYSGRPVLSASFAAAVGLEDYEASIRIIKAGLLANPNDEGLLNNLAYAYACNGQMDLGIQALKKVHASSYHFEVARIANEGLIAYRQADPEAGRAKYLEAMKLASDKKNNDLQARAAFFWAREELRYDPSSASEILKLLDQVEQHLPKREFGELLPRLRSAAEVARRLKP